MHVRVRQFVCPSVYLSTGPQQHTRCCRFAAVGPAGRSIAAWLVLSSSGVRRANAGSATLPAYELS